MCVIPCKHCRTKKDYKYSRPNTLRERDEGGGGGSETEWWESGEKRRLQGRQVQFINFGMKYIDAGQIIKCYVLFTNA